MCRCKMEDKINLPNHESAPSYSKSKLEGASSFFSAVTHPSVRARNTEDIFKRIRSGKDILCKLPTRLDPNIEFSDDDEEEETSDQKKTSDDEEKKRDIPAVEKTPELPSKPQRLFGMRNKTCDEARRLFDYTPAPSVPHPQHFSACKPLAVRSNMDIRSLLPPSENKISRSTKIVPDQHKYLNRDLNVQSQFKAPIQNPITSESSIRQPPLTNEAIKVNNKYYNVLSLLGSGGSCKVYSVYNPEKKSLAAIKRVYLKNADFSVREGYKKEIEYLKKLQGSLRVIKMYDFEYRSEELFLVLEHGDIDFAKYISNEAKLKRLTPLMIKFYWSQMLEAVADIHKYGIVHSDLKPANFLLVEGNLKLIDFGIATSVPEDKTSTFRDTQVGTLNYMSPEAITQLSSPDTNAAVFKVGVKSDVWSLGCILYNLVYGFTPFHHVKNLLQKIQAIVNPSFVITFKPLPDVQLPDVLKLCLKRNPKERASVAELLRHPYLTEDKTSATAEPPKADKQLRNVMEQMQGLTPRRMNYITKMVQELSTNKGN